MEKKVINILSLLFLFATIIGCTKEDPYSFETKIHKLYGDYKLSDINWQGGSVNLDDIYSKNETILTEMKNKIGYYEPDYTATVGDALVLSTDSESEKEPATAFNVTIPYPYYVVVDGEWKCTEIRSFKMTFRVTEDTFTFNSATCMIYPGLNNPDDVFLNNVKQICLYAYPETNMFLVELVCTLPTAWHDSELNERDLTYYYTK